MLNKTEQFQSCPCALQSLTSTGNILASSRFFCLIRPAFMSSSIFSHTTKASLISVESDGSRILGYRFDTRYRSFTEDVRLPWKIDSWGLGAGWGTRQLLRTHSGIERLISWERNRHHFHRIMTYPGILFHFRRLRSPSISGECALLLWAWMNAMYCSRNLHRFFDLEVISIAPLPWDNLA